MKIVLIYEYGMLRGAYIAKDYEDANKIFEEHIGISFEEFEQDDTNYQSNAGSTIIDPTNSPCLLLRGFQGIIDEVVVHSSIDDAEKDFEETTGITYKEFEEHSYRYDQKDWNGTKIMSL